MPTNINGLPFDGGQYYDAQAQRAYVPIYGGGGYSGADNYSPQQITGYRGYAYAPGMYGASDALNGQQYDVFDPQGNKTGNGTWQGLHRSNHALGIGAVLAAPFLMAGAQGLLGAGAAGGAEAAGAANGMWDVLPEAVGNGGLQTSAMGAGAGAGSANGMWDVLPEAASSSGVPPNAWLPGANGVLDTASGLGKSLLTSGLLGPAATLLGALAGSKGVNKSEETVKKMDPRMDSIFYEQLAPTVQGLLAQATSDDRMKQNAQQRQIGAGLLGAPVAGNGYARMYGGR